MSEATWTQSEADRLERRYGALTRDPMGFLERERAKQELQERRQQFAEHQGIGCLRCGKRSGTWVAGGISARGPWILCSICVRRRKP